MRSLRLLSFVALALSTLFVSLFALLPCALGAEFNPADRDSLKHETGIFGRDDRKYAYDFALYSGVHRLITATGGVCTAFLISRRYALTAAHCVADGGPLALQIDRGNNFGEQIGFSFYWSARNYRVAQDSLGRDFLAEDFAILKLASLAPADLQPFEIASPDEVQPGVSAVSVGYPNYTYSTNWRVKDNDCSVRALDGDIIRTDCAMSRGNSGGPLLVKTKSGKWKVAGISSTQYIYSNDTMVLGEPYSDMKSNNYTNISLYFDRVMKTIGAK